MDATELAGTIQAAQAGDGRAFERLVDAFGRRLYGYLYRLTADRQDAEDLLQEVFVRVVRNIRDYHHRDSFQAWLFRIATNLVRDRVRWRRRRPVEASGDAADDGEAKLTQAESREHGPDHALEQADEIDRMQRALARLSDQEREVITLRHFSELSFQQIADMLGCPLGTVLARAHRSLGKLRKLMESDGHVPRPTT